VPSPPRSPSPGLGRTEGDRGGFRVKFMVLQIVLLPKYPPFALISSSKWEKGVRGMRVLSPGEGTFSS